MFTLILLSLNQFQTNFRHLTQLLKYVKLKNKKETYVSPLYLGTRLPEMYFTEQEYSFCFLNGTCQNHYQSIPAFNVLCNICRIFLYGESFNVFGNS